MYVAETAMCNVQRKVHSLDICIFKYETYDVSGDAFGELHSSPRSEMPHTQVGRCWAGGMHQGDWVGEWLEH